MTTAKLDTGHLVPACEKGSGGPAAKGRSRASLWWLWSCEGETLPGRGSRSPPASLELCFPLLASVPTAEPGAAQTVVVGDTLKEAVRTSSWQPAGPAAPHPE